MDKIKNQLAGVAALLGVIAAIGGGFVKYGEIVTKLDALESKEWATVDTTGIETSLAVLEEKVNILENIDTSHGHEFVQHKHDLISHDHPVEHTHTETLINKKEIELLGVRLEEVKEAASNPLAN